MCCFVAEFFFLTTLVNINLSKEFVDSSAFSSAQASAGYYDSNQCKAERTEPVLLPSPPVSQPKKNVEDDFNKGNLLFTSKFFYNVVKENPGKSVTLSPYSTLFLLAQLALYATGAVLQELLKAINLKNQKEIRIVIPAALDSIAEQKNVTFNIAERVYGNIKNNFSYAFKKDTKDIFRAEAENIDFSNQRKAADIINKWVANKTNDKIKDLVPFSLLTPSTKLVLVNAFYFLGAWKYKFLKDNTRPQKFYMSENTTVIVDMMNQVKYFKYAESDDLNAKVIELPYVNGNLTCLIILPNDKTGATRLVTKLLYTNTLTSVRNSLQSTRVDLSLPKFNTTTTIDLQNLLQKLNITELFDPKSSGLRGILAKPENLYVSAGIQKANIVVNELGSEAAAGNAIIGVATAAFIPAPPITFNADHPFIYYLMFEGSPIFCGLFAGN